MDVVRKHRCAVIGFLTGVAEECGGFQGRLRTVRRRQLCLRLAGQHKQRGPPSQA